MFSKILFATVALALVSGPALADAGHGGTRAYGEPGDARKPARTIAVTMRESDGKMMFIPSKIEVRQGEQIKFVLRNNGEIDHEIVLATLAENLKHGAEMQKNPDMEHDDPNARRLSPKKTGEMVWKFTKVGEFDFSCLIPGHREAGMTGTIVVTTKTGAL
ncbi:MULTISPECIES: cupredoxin domain-containing protein [Labrys]|uniref:Cupredoxin family protein n=1 Tax=Labrys neptuniae TaxID=376174 RepID=A0ABV3PU87_9HYPH